MGAKKGIGSVNQGIQFIQDQRISVTQHSLNLIKEYRNYLWRKDKNGKFLNDPEELFNHLMDAVRYGFDGYVQNDLLSKDKLSNIIQTRNRVLKNYAV